MLDDLTRVRKLDEGNILSSIEMIKEQLEDSWKAIQAMPIPQDFSSAKNIIVAGMGGSALGGRIVRHLQYKNIRVPIEIVTNYNLPNYVSKETLAIISSYSGNTEETQEAFWDAVKRRAKIIGITSGGNLLQTLGKENLPVYKIDTKFNPSGQPRMGLGYSIGSILAILSRLNFINKVDEEMENSLKNIQNLIKDFGVRTPSKQNEAKKIAEKLSAKIPILISSEHLVGSAHAMKNQINENSKTFSAHFEISELNHHLLEGLRYPMKAKDILHFVFFESQNYHEKIQKRYNITKDVVKQNGFNYDVYKLSSRRRLDEVLEFLVLGSYVSFYLAILHGINPAPIPWVDYFKERMAQKQI